MSRTNEHCVACDREIRGELQSLPIGNRIVEIVDNNYDGEWYGAAACKTCFDVHAAAGVKGLDAYLKATESLRAELDRAIAALVTIRDNAEIIVG